MDGAPRGVGFRVRVVDSARIGTFLLTAGHAVEREAKRNCPVEVWGLDGSHSEQAEVLVCGGRDNPPDVALLYSEYQFGPPLRLSPPEAESVEARIRGAPAAGSTALCTLAARVMGLERLEGRPVLDLLLPYLSLDEKVLAETSQEALWPRRNPAYQALRGLSGAPVEVGARTGRRCVVGLVFRRNQEGFANRIYAEPVDEISTFLAGADVVLSVEPRLFSATAEFDRGVLGPLLASMLTDHEQAHKVWELFSGLFYSGVPADSFLREAVRQPQEFGLSDEFTLAQVEFLLSRLLLKRGAATEAIALLHNVTRRAGDHWSADQRYLAEVARLRLVVEGRRGDDLQVRSDLLKRALEAIEEDRSRTPAPLRAYEMASAVGKEALLTARLLPAHHREPVVGLKIGELATAHGQLLNAHYASLAPKQEIVSLALSLIDALWSSELDPLAQAHRLGELAARGRAAAGQRENAIFFCQLLLVEAVRGTSLPDANPFALCVLAGHLFRAGDLELSHEGVSQVVDYIRTLHPPLYAALATTHRLGLREGFSFLKSSSDLTIPEVKALGQATDEVSDSVLDLTSLRDAFDLDISAWTPKS